ncbi:dTDP-4-dehydrorhamnose reductase [Candidatus Thalassolituus haligoni]|jgi:dTDP-4-dehydrorhamnose reductase|uniref:dTDP-4-dehydrorhamnose reductase n=1 Tax=Candidatus Thalassolituus haligoni TaxID=3100113 RepID=UPI00351234EB|tara:strand:- start:837 stop:1715 length:879 start_codon:yes stop_codon:yes gene_type:complete
MKWLITGANGQLGRCLQDALALENLVLEHDIVTFSSSELDITNEIAVSDLITCTAPDIVLNAAAYTEVDKAESDTISAFKVNALGVSYLANACKNINARLIHISTDYVFDGTSTTAYQPYDTAAPNTVYGSTKLAGEQSVVNLGGLGCVIRTAWVFSEYGNNFLKTMLRLAETRDEFGVVGDQVGCPTYAGDLAKAIVAIGKADSFPSGVHHFSGDVAVSWWSFAREIHRQAVAQGIITKPPLLKQLSTDEYPTAAPRPAFSVLDCSSLWSLGIVQSDWKKAVDIVLSRLVT